MRKLVCTFVLPVLVLLGGCAEPAPTPPSEAASGHEPAFRNLGAEAAYVGREACGQCHADKLEVFEQSQMGHSFRPATLANSDADFAGPAPLYDPHADLYYQPFHVGEELFVKEYRLAGGDTVHIRIEQIDYIVGSGHHTNSHIREVNGFLYQIPVTWYAQDGRWDFAPGFGDGSSKRFNREIGVECMACHNATPDFVEGSSNRFAEVPHGIDCERCHGPGSIHVEEKLAGEVVDTEKEADYSIVNPARLSLDLQYDVCRRCHMQAISVFKEGKTPLDFRPGMKLSQVMDVFWPRRTDSVETFLMASHPDRLQMSACFEATHQPGSAFEPLTCVTCHDPHVNVKSVPEEAFDAQCQSCHATEHAPVCAEDPALREAQEATCVSCHMPTSPTMDIPHVRVTDHNIRVVEQRTLDAGEAERQVAFVRLASLVDDDPSERARGAAYMNYFEQFGAHPRYLDSAAVHLGRAAARHGTDALVDQLVRLRFLQQDYGAVRRMAAGRSPHDFQDAWTVYRIGQTYAHTGRTGQALRYYERAVELAPVQLQMKRKLADAYASSSQPQRALALYDEILGADPTLAEVYNNRGLLLAQTQDMIGAEEDFRRAISLDPDAEQALANLASLYYNTRREDEARELAERLVRLAPQNRQYRQFLSLME